MWVECPNKQSRCCGFIRSSSKRTICFAVGTTQTLPETWIPCSIFFGDDVLAEAADRERKRSAMSKKPIVLERRQAPLRATAEDTALIHGISCDWFVARPSPKKVVVHRNCPCCGLGFLFSLWLYARQPERATKCPAVRKFSTMSAKSFFLMVWQYSHRAEWLDI